MRTGHFLFDNSFGLLNYKIVDDIVQFYMWDLTLSPHF